MKDTISLDWKLEESFWVLEGRCFGTAFQEPGKQFCLILCLSQLGNNMDNVVRLCTGDLMTREDFSSQKVYRPRTGEQRLNYDSCLLVEQLNQQVIIFSCTGLSHRSKNYLRMFKSCHKTGFWYPWCSVGRNSICHLILAVIVFRFPNCRACRSLGAGFPQEHQRSWDLSICSADTAICYLLAFECWV